MPVLTRKETLTIGSCSPSPDLSPADDLKKFIKLYTQYTGWGEKEKKKNQGILRGVQFDFYCRFY